jgi:hypothetical protein
LFVPELTLWHKENRTLGNLPEKWKDATLAEIAGDLGVAAWCVARPWRIDTPGVEVTEIV